MSDTLNLVGAAALLHQHEHTVEDWARRGMIPAHKVGRRWVFLRAELLAWIAEQPATREVRCSTNAAVSGGSSYPSLARSRLESLLAQPTGKPHRNTTTPARRNSGASTNSANVRELHSRRPLPIG